MQTSLLPTSLGNILYNNLGTDVAFVQVQFSREMGAVRKLCNKNNDTFLGLFADKITLISDSGCSPLGHLCLLLYLPTLKADATEEIVERLKSGMKLKSRPDKVFSYKDEKYIPVEIVR